MNLPVLNFKLIKNPIIHSLLVTLFLSIGYSLLGGLKVLQPSEGVNQWQRNVIRIQRYSYQPYSKLNVVLVGSSLTDNIPTDKIGDYIINLGMSGGCAQTGLEAIIRQDIKPKLLLVELNHTIRIQADKKIIESNYNPVLYPLRRYLPSFREEYKPSVQIILMFHTLSKIFHELIYQSQVVDRQIKTQKDLGEKEDKPLTSEYKKLGDRLISQAIQNNSKLLSEGEKSSLRQESQHIKSQISKIEHDGTQVILFNVPGDYRLKSTLSVKEYRIFMKELFPSNNFDWLPEPPSREWLTGDGVHLVKSDARIYADFLRGRLIKLF
ncbi:hypothetical protein [Chamaesiphon sp. VAR_48_metabat_135_sub]|uniref:hypothetical protein n=1 Tax=Chamaesiphon sp. VAR_48_metabat_135_sub TaxID=2964699 RepID=UPI002869FEB8|nr:hypothetical protein [Chamaesiphon sp. VAR_48_metabat_135_sub]